MFGYQEFDAADETDHDAKQILRLFIREKRRDAFCFQAVLGQMRFLGGQVRRDCDKPVCHDFLYGITLILGQRTTNRSSV
jgi:hypothetical protein